MQIGYRVGLIVVLSLLLLGLAIHYGATYPDRYPHPTDEQLAEDPSGWNGELVMLSGEVTAVDPSGERIDVAIEYRNEIVTVVTAEGVDADVEAGGVVQIYGELDEGATMMEVEEIVVVNRGPEDNLYKLVLSVLGVGLAAAAFLWYWRIDWRRLQFNPRRSDIDG